MKPHTYGFTLLELLVTMAIVAILAALALPSFTTLVANNRLATKANETLAAVMLARSESFKRGKRVVLCKSSDAATCETSSSSPWSSGWIIFVDDDNSGQRTTSSANEPLLRVGESVTGMAIVGSGGAESGITFTGRGVLTVASSSSPKLTFGISGQPRRELDITPTGRASISKGSVYP